MENHPSSRCVSDSEAKHDLFRSSIGTHKVGGVKSSSSEVEFVTQAYSKALFPKIIVRGNTGVWILESKAENLASARFAVQNLCEQ